MNLKGRTVRNQYLEKYIQVLSRRTDSKQPETIPLLDYIEASLNANYRAKKQYQKNGELRDDREEVELRRRLLSKASVFDRGYLSKAYNYWEFSVREFWANYLDFKVQSKNLPTHE